MWKRKILTVMCLLSSGAIAQVCDTNLPATTPTSNFQVHGDGTVTDKKTGLMWKQCPEGQTESGCISGNTSLLTWQAALQVPETINVGGGFAGYTDWRLPNIKELFSIVEEQCQDPAINLSVFPSRQSQTMWSSSPGESETIDSSTWTGSYISAWSVAFYSGGASSYSFQAHSRDEGLAVRLVRNAQ